MALSEALLREMLIQYIGFDPGPSEVQRLLPLVERQLGRMQALRALDLGGDDPRTTSFITDDRLGSRSGSAAGGA